VISAMNEAIQRAIDAVTLGSLYALLALGVAMIFGIMGLINFAHGELIMVGGYSLFFLAGWPLPALIPLMLVLVVALALAMERIAFRPVRGASPATLLVMSFAVSFLLQNVVILAIGGKPRSLTVSRELTQSLLIGSIRIPKLDLVTITATVAFVVALGLFLRRTDLGLQMRAAAEDFGMSRLLGVRANTVIATAFAISGLLAGTASFLLVAGTGTVSPAMGLSPVLAAFVATIIGGLGSLWGAALGGFLLGATTVVFQTFLPLGLRVYRDAFTFAVVLAMLVFLPQGLAGGRSIERRV
jgi:branched-chain amino acid transport system permease protein